VHKKFFWSGSTSESVIWKEGKRDGSAQAWHENGAVKWQKTYAMGKRIQTWRLSFKDGSPWIVAPFSDDKLNGTVQVWDKAAAAQPKEAVFKEGDCASGDCALLDPPVLPVDIPAGEKVEKTREWDLVREFLDQN
jgi:antitoxin component YwqK of YwqJK toxin-antitoxin module